MAFGQYWTGVATEWEGWALTGCAVDAVWVDSLLNLTGPVRRVDSVNIDQMHQDNRTWQDPSNRITISPGWADRLGALYMNISDPNRDFTASGALVLALALSDAGPTPAQEGVEYDQLPEPQKDVLLDYLVETNLLSIYWGATTVFTTNAWTDPSTLTQIKVQNYLDGYGYDGSKVTVQLALVVLGLYCLITLSYLIYTFVSGEVGSSWDSVGELLMLGVNSPRADHLGHASAGIETVNIFREPVNIRVNEQNASLELVFVNRPATAQGTEYGMLFRNKRY